MFFLTMLDVPSAKIIKNLIVSLLLNGRVPPSISFADYFVDKSKELDVSESDEFLCSYVLTSSVTGHIVNLARAVYIKKYPVLLQGPTSSGKTSLVRYLAAKTGHEFIRINNHEHTDLQEYLGTYVPDSHGKLKFQEGALVKAVREGHWIVLDELNLAPSDVLEALNRLLDDNRELFVPELQETIPAHPEFMLFATQNPPVLYGGRKMLSRAFRNRFIEVHVDEIPEDELITILEQRCTVARSYATKMVQVMKDLQTHRQNSRVFAGRHGFITARDLFRWASRYRTFEGKSYEDLAKDGYLLLAERLRDDNEKAVVQEALERQLCVKLNIPDLYNSEGIYGDNISPHAIRKRVQENFGNITWTKSMWRLYFLIERCYRSREPVLLVGETGGGKTTVCQVLSAVLGVKLHILNCHQYTETSDFIGGFCPIRDRSRIALEFKHLISTMKEMKIFIHVAGDVTFPSDISGAVNVINHINGILDKYRKGKELFPEVQPQELDDMEQIKLKLTHLHQNWQAIFLWQDGPLVQAMKNGDLFLIDEISLADDSVLERLNSVLEPERKLSLAEKGGSVLEKIVAHPNFFILATMNPGGDYGKKELSPALRNRFTELWVPAVTDVDELKSIAIDKDFIWYSKESCVQRNCMYLQSLGAQYAAYQISNLEGSSSLLGPTSNIHPFVLPASSLSALQFPTLSTQHFVKARVHGEFNSELADQMLFIAANWVIAQSTKSDLELYGIWFKWYNCLLQPYCSFFGDYANILKQSSEHPIWQSILECYSEIIAYHKVDVVAHPIALLSVKLLDMAGCDTLKACQKRLRSALNGLSLLWHTLQQWQSETTFPDYGVLKATLLPALKSLRCLEDEVLKMIVKSRKVLQIYTRLLDYHRNT
uniref:Uncharacterized protein n=1 Tax=Avena sativa TaxID=4498 RepID=A0ACD5W9Q4_AVESA